MIELIIVVLLSFEWVGEEPSLNPVDKLLCSGGLHHVCAIGETARVCEPVYLVFECLCMLLPVLIFLLCVNVK